MLLNCKRMLTNVKRLPVCVEVSKVIEGYANEVQGIQTRREEE